MVDVSDDDIERNPDDVAAEELWRGRVTRYAPGFDPNTERNHADPTTSGISPEMDGDPSWLGSEVLQIMRGYPAHLTDMVPSVPDDVMKIYDIRSPIGTPEGTVPKADEGWPV